MKRRLIFGSILLTLSVFFLVIDLYQESSLGVFLLATLFLLPALGELYRLAQRKGIEPMTRLGFFLAFLLLFLWWRSLTEAAAAPSIVGLGTLGAEGALGRSGDVPLLLAFCLGLVLIACLFRPTGEGQLIGTAFTAFGLVYVAFLGGFVMEVRFLKDPGRILAGGRPSDIGAHVVLLMLITCKASDSFAYFSGHWFGKRKLAPRISPGKTVEGLGGAVLGSAVLALLYVQASPLGALVSWWQAGLFGILLAVVGQVGDLAESYVKRSLGTKDSSGFIPEFGGLLDLVDSLLFAAPFTFVYFRWVGLSPG